MRTWSVVVVMLTLVACKGDAKKKPAEKAPVGEPKPADAPPQPPHGTQTEPPAPKPIELAYAQAQGLLTYLEGIPSGWDGDRLIGSMAAQCSTIPGCAPEACKKVLGVCATVTAIQCGEFLSLECEDFSAGGATGEELGKKAGGWIVKRFGDVVEVGKNVLEGDESARLVRAWARVSAAI